jgi:catalase
MFEGIDRLDPTKIVPEELAPVQTIGQVPVNRPHAPVNDMYRDGLHQSGVHSGVAPYKPNSLDGGCPFTAGEDLGAYLEVPQEIKDAVKVREAPASYSDSPFDRVRRHYSRWNSNARFQRHRSA